MFSLWMPKRLILGRDWECSFAFSVKAECLLPRAAVVVRVAITSGHGMGPLIAGKNGSRLAGLSNHREQITNISFEQVKRARWVCKPTLGNFCHFLVFFWGNSEKSIFFLKSHAHLLFPRPSLCPWRRDSSLWLDQDTGCDVLESPSASASVLRTKDARKYPWCIFPRQSTEC